MLTTHLPLRLGKKQGDLKKGIGLINQYLKKEVGLKGYKLKEPSGLSRKNRFSVNHFQKLLLKGFSEFYYPEIFASYPIAGGVGTLEQRFQNKISYLPVRAKTGSISGVLGLSGYIVSPKKQKIIFTFLYNGSPRQVSQAKELFDDIVIFLWEESKK